MTAKFLISNATDSPRPLGEGLGVEPVETVRSKTKRQIELTMFAAAVGTLEGLRATKLVEQ